MSDMDIVARLSTLAAQENCDGEPWDTMQDASMEIRLLRSRLERAEGLLRKAHSRIRYEEGDDDLLYEKIGKYLLEEGD